MTIKSTAKYLIIRRYLSRYELALKAASKSSSLDKQTIYDNTYNHDDYLDEIHYNFIVSENITPSGNGYYALHNWIFRQSSGLRDFDI